MNFIPVQVCFLTEHRGCALKSFRDVCNFTNKKMMNYSLHCAAWHTFPLCLRSHNTLELVDRVLLLVWVASKVCLFSFSSQAPPSGVGPIRQTNLNSHYEHWSQSCVWQPLKDNKFDFIWGYWQPLSWNRRATYVFPGSFTKRFLPVLLLISLPRDS